MKAVSPLVGALVLLAGAVLGTACGRGGETAPVAAPSQVPADRAGLIVVPPDSPQFKQLRVAPVSVAELPTDEVTAPGRVIIDPNRISRVLPPVGGRILKVMVRFGDQVEQGQELLTMDSADGDAAVSAYLQAVSTERQTKAALEKAEADFSRTSDLYEHKAVAEKDVLQAKNDLATSKSSYEIAQAVREQTRRKLQLLELDPNQFHQPILVRAPITGRVLDVNVAPGEYRAAISFHTDTTAPLLSIADLSTVWFAAEVPEASIRLVRAGEPVSITLIAFPDEVFMGRVTRIADVLDPQTRTVKVYAELPNTAGRLRPDMFGSLRASGRPVRQAVLPLSAVVEEYGKRTVFRERAPGQFERREVTLGPPRGDLAPVQQGVGPGDRVIVDGAMLLKDR
ncbi:MAG TPA: efflux RND transporter periplasmic adaptor subunit [Candidatus Methylomirabilis sp.]|nr:efflux RND transporter periplasmic adaptor subunit [Candidatus Methylomirabilis sp.]